MRKLYLRDAVEFRDAGSTKQPGRCLMEADTKLAKSLAAQAEAHFRRPSPSAVEPTLRNHARTQKLSYPSVRAAYVHFELIVLSKLDPERAAEFQQMTAQADYSRLCAAGHYRSELIAGTFVGYLIGDYVLRNATASGSAGCPFPDGCRSAAAGPLFGHRCISDDAVPDLAPTALSRRPGR